MPTPVPNIDGLRPLEEIASQYYLRPAEVKAILEEAGVRTMPLSVSRKRIELVEVAAASSAIARHLLAEQEPAPDGYGAGYTPLTERLDRQRAALEQLQEKVDALLVGLRKGGQ